MMDYYRLYDRFKIIQECVLFLYFWSFKWFILNSEKKKKNYIFFKVINVTLNDFESFQMILTKYITDITYVTHIHYMTHITCITHITYVTHGTSKYLTHITYMTHITYITYIVKLSF